MGIHLWACVCGFTLVSLLNAHPLRAGLWVEGSSWWFDLVHLAMVVLCYIHPPKACPSICLLVVGHWATLHCQRFILHTPHSELIIYFVCDFFTDFLYCIALYYYTHTRSPSSRSLTIVFASLLRCFFFASFFCYSHPFSFLSSYPLSHPPPISPSLNHSINQVNQVDTTNNEYL